MQPDFPSVAKVISVPATLILSFKNDFWEYTPATVQTPGTWTATGSMNFARANFTATLLPNGKVWLLAMHATFRSLPRRYRERRAV